MDSENQIDNSSLLDSLLDGNDQIGGDAVGTSDEVNKSSKRMQYFGAVFNLANTVCEIVLFFGVSQVFFLPSFLRPLSRFFRCAGSGCGYSCNALCIRASWTRYGTFDYSSRSNALCSFTRDCHSR